MATLVFVHAHPDDEASQTAGSMARAVAEGHRVVVVYATNGDHGDRPDDLAEEETLVDRRRVEATRSNEVIGTHRVVWLGYADSGMSGWDQNDHEASFARADVEEAAERLAEVLREEAADIVWATTGTVATVTPTTSRSMQSPSARPSWRARRATSRCR